MNEVRPLCEYFDRAGGYCIEGASCACRAYWQAYVPTRTTHPLLDCKQCGRRYLGATCDCGAT